MNDTQAILAAAREYLKNKQWDEARRLLEPIRTNPTATKWLAKVDEITGSASQQVPAPTSEKAILEQARPLVDQKNLESRNSILSDAPGSYVTPQQTTLPSEKTKKCPYCAEIIKAEAKVCRYCGTDLTREDPFGKQTGNKGKRKNKSSNEKDKVGETVAAIGIVLGIIGLCYAGGVFGALAILCGLVASGRGTSTGVTALLLGIVDIVLVVLIINSYYS